MYFYIQNLTQTELNPEQSAHFMTMRVQVGDVLCATDLQGNLAKITIKTVDKKQKTISYKILKTQQTSKSLSKAPNQKILFQAIPDKAYLEKLVEILPLLGVDIVYLFFAERSIKCSIQVDRLSKILIRSCEQSQSVFCPKIQILNTKQELELLLQDHKPVVLECEDMATVTIGNCTQNTTKKPALVGCEGGWTSVEIQYFQSLGLDFVHLGNTIYPAWYASSVYFLGNL